MRKDIGTAGTSLLRRCRVPLLAVGIVLAFLLGAAATGASATTAFAAPAAAKPAGAPPAAKPGNDPDEEKSKREAEHGQPRGTARRSVGVPRHTGRPLPPYDVQGSTFPADGPEGPTTHRSTRAASRPAALPVLHCVFRC
ncbi:hypothetical protein [Streptomyces lydicus]|uniref:hypothetical protein n=1 Tax=Streptomyces lydicus TaxID=47763 RepID=UPI000525FFE7|nr:hypothetical protein [Streptomyces lydicus]UEG89971.1 hypothetical protein LJ741_05145 [Streptomyces lydicus]